MPDDHSTASLFFFFHKLRITLTFSYLGFHVKINYVSLSSCKSQTALAAPTADACLAADSNAVHNHTPRKKKKSGDLQEQTIRNPSAWQKYSRTSSLSETSSLRESFWCGLAPQGCEVPCKCPGAHRCRGRTGTHQVGVMAAPRHG